MPRTKLKERILPRYSRGEEIFNMVTHIVGGAVGIAAVLACAIVAALRENKWGVVSGSIYGATVVIQYAVSSIYHGLTAPLAKKIFRIFDHCAIFVMIAGTYTPVLLGNFQVNYAIDAWVIFGFIWGAAVLGIVVNSIDLKKFKGVSVVCYIVMGWCMVFRFPRFWASYPPGFFILLFGGGFFYTLGAAFYALGKKKKFIHSVFHIFTDVASVLHLVGIAVYVM